MVCHILRMVRISLEPLYGFPWGVMHQGTMGIRLNMHISRRIQVGGNRVDVHCSIRLRIKVNMVVIYLENLYGLLVEWTPVDIVFSIHTIQLILVVGNISKILLQRVLALAIRAILVDAHCGYVILEVVHCIHIILQIQVDGILFLEYLPVVHQDHLMISPMAMIRQVFHYGLLVEQILVEIQLNIPIIQ